MGALSWNSPPGAPSTSDAWRRRRCRSAPPHPPPPGHCPLSVHPLPAPDPFPVARVALSPADDLRGQLGLPVSDEGAQDGGDHRLTRPPPLGVLPRKKLPHEA